MLEQSTFLQSVAAVAAAFSSSLQVDAAAAAPVALCIALTCLSRREHTRLQLAKVVVQEPMVMRQLDLALQPLAAERVLRQAKTPPALVPMGRLAAEHHGRCQALREEVLPILEDQPYMLTA